MNQLVFVTNSTAAISEATYDGKTYLIAPVVAIKEGVLNGYLYLAEEFSKFVEAWNGRPVPLGHPKRNGEYVSANTPDIWATEVPGYFWNVTADTERLKGEIWIDLEKAAKIGEPATNVVERLRAGEGIEVSTGLWFELEESPGVWKGVSYEGIARNIRPDHLALLPNEVGACSWDDGCGVPRVNQKGAVMGNEVTVNELTLDDRASLVRRSFWDRVRDAMPGDLVWGDWDVLHVFDATVIVKDWDKKTHAAFPYTIDEAGNVTLGTPTPVDVVYRAKDGGAEVVIANADAKQQGLFARFRHWLSAGRVEGVSVGASPVDSGAPAPAINEQESDVSKCDLVANILANKHNKFSKEALDGLNEATLETLRQSLPAETQAAAPVVNQTTTAAAPVAQGIDPKALAETIRAVVNEAMAPVLQTITANADRERAELVAEIVANSTMKAEHLKGVDLEGLRELASNLQPRDYSGGGGVFRGNTDDSEEYVMPMPNVWTVAEEGK